MEKPTTRDIPEIGKRELELVFDLIPDQVCILDESLTILRANRSCAEAVRISEEQLTGMSCEMLHHCGAQCPVRETFETGKPVIKRRLSKELATVVIHFEVSAFPVFDDNGKVIHVVEFKKDITDEKKMIEQLIRSEKLASIGNMTAGVAHEMNNPLSGISGMAANLLQMPEKYGLNEKGINRVNLIMNSAIRATTIMNDLLHLSDKVEQMSILVNINGLIMKTVNALHITGAQQIERTYTLDDTIELYQCDPSKIQQVIVHIVTNAMNAILDKIHSDENGIFKGHLGIASHKTDKEIIITVKDNGVGISPSNRTKIFNPFFSTRPTGQGTGLGLSVSNKIIEEHGGKIFFECMKDLTVFTIHLPLERSAGF